MSSLSHRDKQALNLAAATHLLRTKNQIFHTFEVSYAAITKASGFWVNMEETASRSLLSMLYHLGGFPNQINGYAHNEKLKISLSQELWTQDIVVKNLFDQDYLPHKATHGVENLPVHNAQKFKGKVTGVKAHQNAISFDSEAEIWKRNTPRMSENASQASFYSSQTDSASVSKQLFINDLDM